MIETKLLPKVISSPELVYQIHLRRIYQKVAEFDGFTKQYLVSDSGERAAVLVTCGSYILLVRPFRLLINDISLEIPGGNVDERETSEKTAICECQEETGVECRNLKYLLNYYPGLDVTDNPTFIFYSNDPIQSSITRTERSLWLPLDICLEIIFKGKIQDAMTIIALLTYSIRFRSEWKMKEMSMNEINPACALARIHTEFKIGFKQLYRLNKLIWLTLYNYLHFVISKSLCVNSFCVIPIRLHETILELYSMVLQSAIYICEKNLVNKGSVIQ